MSGVTTSPASGQVNTGHSVTISLAMSEKVSETGAPVLLLNNGGTAAYKSGNGTSTLNFGYTVAAGQMTSDLRVSGIVLSSPSAPRIASAPSFMNATRRKICSMRSTADSTAARRPESISSP